MPSSTRLTWSLNSAYAIARGSSRRSAIVSAISSTCRPAPVLLLRDPASTPVFPYLIQSAEGHHPTGRFHGREDRAFGKHPPISSSRKSACGRLVHTVLH